ncbi:hypothetical protein GN958_ATG13843 [Phytophthora infestans]|uniref:Uncharacterized protein n=1 Tax=Phytophthora infestans TaxID=4787 RepID=A0A8S9UDA6_PHYIN|nr:hypothetical protein GN958_ATG13843 [Phytophthora infestans]
MQLDNWLATGRTADDVYGLLKLNVDMEGILRNPLLKTWITFEHLDVSRYDEEELAHMLVVTESVIARDVEMALLKSWLSKGKTAEDAFKLLRLNSEKGDDILTNPVGTRFSDEALAKMLVAAAIDVRVQINVHVPALVMMQLKSWLKEGRAADDVFSLLTLNDKLFDTSMLSTWRSYLQMLDKKNADELMISVIRKYYEDEILEKMIVRAQARVLLLQIWRGKCGEVKENPQMTFSPS